jgi:hypothetical protein
LEQPESLGTFGACALAFSSQRDRSSWDLQTDR